MQAYNHDIFIEISETLLRIYSLHCYVCFDILSNGHQEKVLLKYFKHNTFILVKCGQASYTRAHHTSHKHKVVSGNSNIITRRRHKVICLKNTSSESRYISE